MVNPDQSDRLGGRNGDIWRAYTTGRNQEWIARKYGISQQRVSQILAEVRDTLPDDVKKTWQLIAIETLGNLHAAMADLADATPPPMFSPGGKLLRDEDDNVVRDMSARLSAVAAVLRIQERAAKLLGLDEPSRSRVEVITEEMVDAEIRRLEDERANRGALGEAPPAP